MTMHLAHPALSTTGKRKGKIKFKSAEDKRRHEQLEQEWKELLKRQGAEADARRQRRAMTAEPLSYKLSAPAGRGNLNHLPSLTTPGHSTAPVHKVYTGTKVMGIATMHKSNAVPVFSDEEAVEISRMRRG
jgi:hypothetical protein